MLSASFLSDISGTPDAPRSALKGYEPFHAGDASVRKTLITLAPPPPDGAQWNYLDRITSNSFSIVELHSEQAEGRTPHNALVRAFQSGRLSPIALLIGKIPEGLPRLIEGDGAVGLRVSLAQLDSRLSDSALERGRLREIAAPGVTVTFHLDKEPGYLELCSSEPLDSQHEALITTINALHQRWSPQPLSLDTPAPPPLSQLQIELASFVRPVDHLPHHLVAYHSALVPLLRINGRLFVGETNNEAFIVVPSTVSLADYELDALRQIGHNFGVRIYPFAGESRRFLHCSIPITVETRDPSMRSLIQFVEENILALRKNVETEAGAQDRMSSVRTPSYRPTHDYLPAILRCDLPLIWSLSDSSEDRRFRSPLICHTDTEAWVAFLGAPTAKVEDCQTLVHRAADEGIDAQCRRTAAGRVLLQFGVLLSSPRDMDTVRRLVAFLDRHTVDLALSLRPPES